MPGSIKAREMEMIDDVEKVIERKLREKIEVEPRKLSKENQKNI
jgi:hypothetical protein